MAQSRCCKAYYTIPATLTYGSKMLRRSLTRDDSMEAGTLITIPLLTSAEGAEVFRCFGYNVGVELEDYSCRWACQNVRADECK